MTHQKAQSHLYTLFETFLQKKKPNRVNDENILPVEKPINVFHMNKKSSQEEAKEANENKISKVIETDKKKSRVEILSKREIKPVETKPHQQASIEPNPKSISVIKKDGRLFLKKLEFEFKWTNGAISNRTLQSRQVVDIVTGVINSLKESIQKDIQDFDADERLINKNFSNLIRQTTTNNESSNKKKLIEEI